MKNRKKQFLKIGGIVAVFAVVGIVAGVMQYKKDHRFDLTVAEHTISKEEYVNCMESVETISGRKSIRKNTGMKFWRKIQSSS